MVFHQDSQVLASADGRPAFEDLYEGSFAQVYDFVYRLLRQEDGAAAAVRDAYIEAARRLPALPDAVTSRSWLFAAVREVALARLTGQRDGGPSSGASPAQDSPLYWRLDPARAPDPAVARTHWEFAALVWEAVDGLDRRQYALLDLHVRQGLDSGEMADALGASAVNASMMLARLREATEAAATAHAMLRLGRRACEVLDHLVANLRVGETTPEARRMVDRHVGSCAACRATRRRMPAALDVFAAFGLIPAPAGLRDRLLAEVLAAWPDEPAAPPEPAPTPNGAAMVAEPDEDPGPDPAPEPAGNLLVRFVGSPLGSLATGMGAAFLLIIGLLWLDPLSAMGGVASALNSEGSPATVGVVGTPTPTTPARAAATRAPALVTPDRSEFVPAEVEPTEPPVPTEAPTTEPTQAPTAEPTSTPTPVPSPAATETATVTPTAVETSTAEAETRAPLGTP